MSKHTPGPWNIHPNYHAFDGEPTVTDDFEAITIAIAKGEQLLGEVTGWKFVEGYAGGYPRVTDFEETRANAQLIAAAPELAKALQGVLEFFNRPHSFVARREAFEKGRAALKKAGLA
jgi:hypothetical protein